MTQRFFCNKNVRPLIFWGFLEFLEIAILAGISQFFFSQFVLAQSESRVPLPPSQKYTQLTQKVAERENATIPKTVENSSLGNPAAQRGGDIAAGEASYQTRFGSAFVISPDSATSSSLQISSPSSHAENSPKTSSSQKTPTARFAMVEPPKKGENRVLVTGVIDSDETPKKNVAVFSQNSPQNSSQNAPINFSQNSPQNFSAEKTSPLTWSTAPQSAEKIAPQSLENLAENSAAKNVAKNNRAVPVRNGATFSFSSTQSESREKSAYKTTIARDEKNDRAALAFGESISLPPITTLPIQTPIDFSALETPMVSEIVSPVAENPVVENSIIVVEAENKNEPEAIEVIEKIEIAETKIPELPKTEIATTEIVAPKIVAAEKPVISEITIREVEKSETETKAKSAPRVTTSVIAKQIAPTVTPWGNVATSPPKQPVCDWVPAARDEPVSAVVAEKKETLTLSVAPPKNLIQNSNRDLAFQEPKQSPQKSASPATAQIDLPRKEIATKEVAANYQSNSPSSFSSLVFTKPETPAQKTLVQKTLVQNPTENAAKEILPSEIVRSEVLPREIVHSEIVKTDPPKIPAAEIFKTETAAKEIATKEIVVTEIAPPKIVEVETPKNTVAEKTPLVKTQLEKISLPREEVAKREEIAKVETPKKIVRQEIPQTPQKISALQNPTEIKIATTTPKAETEIANAPAPIAALPEEKMAAKQLRRAPIPIDDAEEAGMSRSAFFASQNEEDDDDAGFSTSGAFR